MLSLYNSLTRKIEPFVPLTKEEVKMFTCGPSIYQRPHIGNYRTFLFEDILQRYLEYLGYKVKRALNFTDIEEKSIKEAKMQHMDVFELTEKYGNIFFQEMELLRARSPTYNPRSSTSVDEAVLIIEELLEKGYAYWHKGNVYFDPLKFKDFGKLGQPDMSRWPKQKRRFHKDTYPGNYWNLGDFILWHGYKTGDTVYWDTSIGRGRPAWNIQDPAMAIQTLGRSIDICCGGEDNLVRHHDYTIAVVESMTEKTLARYWLHGSHLLVNGKKMSKSKRNVIFLDDLTKKGYTGVEIRFFLIYGNYNKKLNFTFDKIIKTSEKLKSTVEMIDIIRNVTGGKSSRSVKELTDNLEKDFQDSMNNNLDVRQAFDKIVLTLSNLAELAGKNMIADDMVSRIIKILTSIDSVLQVFGLARA